MFDIVPFRGLLLHFDVTEPKSSSNIRTVESVYLQQADSGGKTRVSQVVLLLVTLTGITYNAFGSPQERVGHSCSIAKRTVEENTLAK